MLNGAARCERTAPRFMLCSASAVAAAATAPATRSTATPPASTAAAATITPGVLRLQAHDILRFEALRLLDHVELDGFPLVQRLEAHAFDGAVVDEHVGAAFLLDEAEPLLLRKPLHLPFHPLHLNLHRRCV